MEKGVREVIATEMQDDIYEQNVRRASSFIRFVKCKPHQIKTKDDKDSDRIDMELCLLRHLAMQHPEAQPNSYVMVATANTILEPTALEKLWIYIFVRPEVNVVRPLAYDEQSLRQSLVEADPMFINVTRPSNDPLNRQSVQALPMMFMEGEYKVLNPENQNNTRVFWDELADIIQDGRILRQPLFTMVDTSVHKVNIPAAKQRSPTLSLHKRIFAENDLPAHMWSEHAYYKWSARNEEDEIYSNRLETEMLKSSFDLWSMPFRKIAKHNDKPRIMFIMPWIQMGGSEKCILDIAERAVKLEWSISFILTMPFWREDSVGEFGLKHEWMNKALAVTSDVFDLVDLGPNDKFSKLLRYFVETRSPDYIFTGNSRVIYEHVKFLKAISPGTIVADYNHMVHMDWEVAPGMGGGMPRYGTTFSPNIDLHLTASDNVTTSMKKWIEPDILEQHPEKVKTCYIGTDPSTLHSDDTKSVVRAQIRNDLDISDDKIVVLFAGRFVKDKGIDVMADVLRRVSADPELSSKLAFVFVGSGEQKDTIEKAQKDLHGKDLKIVIEPPADGITVLRNYYAMADIFLLPSNNEGIALVLFEAMAAGLLVMATDVGGQKELVRTNTGVLLPNLNNPPASASFIVQQLQAVSKFRPMFSDIQKKGTEEVRLRFTTEKFCDCVLNNMIRTKKELEKEGIPEIDSKVIEATRNELAEVMRGERVHGAWNREQTDRSIDGQVTIGIKTYVCDASIVRQVIGLVRSIRVNYPTVRVLLANDGPTALADAPLIKMDPHTEEVTLAPDSGISVGRNMMVNMTTTKFFLLLDDDHVFDEDTDLSIGVRGIQFDDFDVVGIRVRNLPGIEEMENEAINIPRYVAKVSRYQDREVTLCVWNENNGPGIQKMRVPIRVDVLHNALIAKTDVLRAHPWRNILKVNEHMTFFLDARKAGVKVGYLPSVFVHHRARRDSKCYKVVRFREESFENLLEYKDDFLWDASCGDNFPEAVRQHLNVTKDRVSAV